MPLKNLVTDGTLTSASAATSLNDQPFPSRSASISAMFHGDRFERLAISEDRIEPILPFCQTVFCSLLRNGRTRQVGFKIIPKMTRSRTKAPLLTAFGGVLKHLHEAHARDAGKTLSHDALSRTLTIRVGKRVSPSLRLGGSTLWRWEAGEVASPDPLILRELADMYGVRFDGLLAVLEANLKNPNLTAEEGIRILAGDRDLIRQSIDQPSDPSRGSDGSATAALFSLQQQHDALLAATEQMFQQLVVTLGKQGVDVAVSADNARTGKGKSHPRARARKAG